MLTYSQILRGDGSRDDACSLLEGRASAHVQGRMRTALELAVNHGGRAVRRLFEHFGKYCAFLL